MSATSGRPLADWLETGMLPVPPLRETGFARLMDRASRRFAWHWSNQQIAGQLWAVATASDPEGMLLEACRRQDAGETGVIDPFWATVWRAATGLGCFLDRYDLNGVRVLELGCGTGQAGLAAALRNAEVTFTDGVSDPLLLVRLTLWTIRHRCRVRCLRFGIDRLEGENFPMILGSDVTYLRHLWPALDGCLRQHLTEDGEVLLSDPQRMISAEFRDQLDQHYWSYEEHRVELPDDPEHPIRVMRLQRK